MSTLAFRIVQRCLRNVGAGMSRLFLRRRQISHIEQRVRLGWSLFRLAVGRYDLVCAVQRSSSFRRVG